jgi:thioesterase domain-containing protein
VIQVAELEAEHPPSIDVLAAGCLATVRANQATGPYVLAGWSLGGLIALDLARQLEDIGQSVSLVAVLDSRARTAIPGHGAVPLTAFASYLAARHGQAFAFDPGWPMLDEDAQLDRVLAWARTHRALPPGYELGELRQVVAGYAQAVQARFALLAHHQPQPCAAPLLYLRARAPLEHGVPDLAEECRSWSRATVRVVDVPGDHYSMLMSPNVDAVALELSAWLVADREPRTVAVR